MCSLAVAMVVFACGIERLPDPPGAPQASSAAAAVAPDIADAANALDDDRHPAPAKAAPAAVTAKSAIGVALPAMACPDIGPQVYELAHPGGPETQIVASPIPARAAPPPGMTAAAHDAEVIALAATDDERAAVSADRRGGMRLWPSLDGAREPLVIDAGLDARQLAIARDGDELVVAAVGAMGQLVVLRFAAAGQLVSRDPLDLPRPLVALRAVASGFVGLREDQTLTGLDLHGAPRGTLRPGPGERIAELAARRGRLLALVTSERGVRARWIEMTEQLAWGPESAALPIDPTHAALATDLQRVAALSTSRRKLVIASLRDGSLDEHTLGDDQVVFPVRPVGFLGPRHLVAIDADREPAWWTIASDDHLGGAPISGPVVVTDRHLISPSGAGLMLSAPDGDTRFLGFRRVGASAAVRHGTGWMISNGRSVFSIDGRLAARDHYLAPKAGDTAPDDVLLLDDRHWVMRFTDRTYLVDVAHPEARVLLATWRGPLHYEPATRLLTIDCGTAQWIGRYDAATGEFRDSLLLPRPAWIELLDPGTNRGNVAWQLVVDDSAVHATAIRAIDFAANPPLRTGSSITRPLPIELRTVNGRPPPGARKIAQMPPQPAEIAAMFAELLRADARQRTSPDRSLIATVGGGRVALRDRSGRLRWQVALPGADDVAWGSRGELIALGAGIARLDLATGAPTARRCGWDFGLWREDEASWGSDASLCEAP